MRLKNAPPLKHKNKICIKDKEKSEVFAEILEEQFSLNTMIDTAKNQDIEKNLDILKKTLKKSIN